MLVLVIYLIRSLGGSAVRGARMIVVVGLSHRTAPVDVRESSPPGADALPAVLARLAARSELAEVIFLSTCNRVEVFALAPPAAGDEGIEAALRAIREELARHGGARSGDDLAPYLYDKRGDEAVRARVPRRGEPRLDGARRAADPRAGQGGVRRRRRPRARSRARSAAA